MKDLQYSLLVTINDLKSENFVQVSKLSFQLDGEFQSELL